jgi:uncharacterized protein (TIGR00730 family)
VSLSQRYTTNDPQLDQEIQALVTKAGNPVNADLIYQMIVTAFKLSKDNTERGDLKIMNTTLKEMRHTWRVYGPYRRQRKVSVFGSARTPEESSDYKQAEEFSRLMSEAGFMSITGGGNGIMKAGNAGAGRANSFAANIRLPFEQASNSAIDGDSKVIYFKYFFTRKIAFLKESHAVVCFPGGFGTHDEGFEALTLVQTGKSHMIPIVFVHPPGSDFWFEWENYVKKHLLSKNLISPEDTSLYLVTDDVNKACEEILRFYRRYHSSRYVGDDLVIRLTDPLTPQQLEEINSEFNDLLVSGSIEAISALPQEANDPDIAHLPRLKLRFARKRIGRLRQLIDRLNDCPLHLDAAASPGPEVGQGGTIPDEAVVD